jgi:Tfp pilus assembly protein PilF
MISYKDEQTTIAESRIDVIKDLMQLASAMNDPKYIEVVSSLNNKVNTFNPDKSFHNLGLEKARENALDLKSNTEIDTLKFNEEAETSLLKFETIQATANFDKIDEFMNSYNTKI